jgi:hypothetical protein
MMELFKRKSKHSVAATAIALPVLNNSGSESLEAKLRAELRYCGTCSYEINNPMTDRCPRCFSLVPLSEHTNCGDCSHQGNCTFQQMHK